jgi:P27 family predicted phage terminase small subunit
MGGRPPLPNEYHKLTKPKLYGVTKARVENTPTQKKALKPRCPPYLTKDQKKEWRFYAKILQNYSMFVCANQGILDLLAVNMVQYKDCLLRVQQTGLLIKSPTGFPLYNPYWTAMNKLEDKILKCLKELGLSSAGLASIGALVAGAKKKSKMEELLD